MRHRPERTERRLPPRLLVEPATAHRALRRGRRARGRPRVRRSGRRRARARRRRVASRRRAASRLDGRGARCDRRPGGRRGRRELGAGERGDPARAGTRWRSAAARRSSAAASTTATAPRCSRRGSSARCGGLRWPPASVSTSEQPALRVSPRRRRDGARLACARRRSSSRRTPGARAGGRSAGC